MPTLRAVSLRSEKNIGLCIGILLYLIPLLSHAQFNVIDFGASPGNFEDDTIAIQAAIDAAIRKGGGEVFFPPGSYVIGVIGTGLDLSGANNVKIVGSGIGTTSVYAAPGTNWHIFSFANASDVGISDMTINGNRETQNAGHCIRGAEINGFTIENVHLQDCYGYGIGLQSGTFARVFINSVVIEDVGQDGIDIKNLKSNNEQVFISNLLIKSPGRNRVNQSGLCLRGHIILSNIVVSFSEKTMAGAVGVRFRAGEVSTIHGIGGHYSSLSNFSINGNDSSTGVIVSAREVQISNGYISGGTRGVWITANDASVTNVAARNVDGAAFLLDSGANYTKIVNSRAVACTTGLAIESEYNNISNSEFRGNSSYGIHLDTTAYQNRIFHNNVTANRTDLFDRGKETILDHNLGI
jgi:polygalacturonase